MDPDVGVSSRKQQQQGYSKPLEFDDASIGKEEK